MRTLEMTRATAPLVEYARELDEGPIILTVNGKPTAALVRVDNTDAETASLSANSQFMALIERSRARQRAEGGISSAEMRERLHLAKPRVSRGAKRPTQTARRTRAPALKAKSD